MNRPSTCYIIKHVFKEDSRVIKIKGNVEVEDDVWIGANSVILGGVRIGKSAVIAAGSIVTKDVLPFSVVAGNPAKTIKMRFCSEVIDILEKSNWWNWDIEEIKQRKAFFETNFNTPNIYTNI